MQKDKIKYYQADNSLREKLVHKLAHLLEQEEKVLFAYLHGSFVDNKRFRDIDVGIFLQEMPPIDRLNYELELEELLSRELKYPADVRSLNQAPPSFCYAVIKKGNLILEKDEAARVEFEMMTLRKYFDFLPFRRRFLQEVLNDDD